MVLSKLSYLLAKALPAPPSGAASVPRETLASSRERSHSIRGGVQRAGAGCPGTALAPARSVHFV